MTILHAATLRNDAYAAAQLPPAAQTRKPSLKLRKSPRKDSTSEWLAEVARRRHHEPYQRNDTEELELVPWELDNDPPVAFAYPQPPGPYNSGEIWGRGLDYRWSKYYNQEQRRGSDVPGEFLPGPRTPDGGVREGDNWHSDEAILDECRGKMGSARQGESESECPVKSERFYHVLGVWPGISLVIIVEMEKVAERISRHCSDRT